MNTRSAVNVTNPTSTPAQAARAGEKGAAPPSPASPPKFCGAKSKNTGQPCRMHRGTRTDHPGYGRCWLHNGRSQHFGQRERHGGKPGGMLAMQLAENALAKLDLPESEDPIAALLEALRIASWRELGLRRLLSSRQTLSVTDHLGDEREDVISSMHERALKRRAEIAKMAVDAGLDSRIVQLAERESELVVRAIQAALDAAGVDGPGRLAAEAAAAEVLEPSMPSGAELS